MGDEKESRRVPVFLAYRQGEDEGDACAAWLHASLKDRSIPIDGEQWAIDTYWDQTAPAVDDWRNVWEGYLRTARALILICTPGTALRRDGTDWFFEEIRWWVENRSVGPILVNASDLDPAPVPEPVAKRWGFAQWVAWSDDALNRERALSRITEGIVLAEQGVRYEELERTHRLLHEAEIARLDALAALNKSEALHIRSMPDLGDKADEQERLHHQELQVLGRKYEKQMNMLADQADGLRRQGPPEPARRLTGVPRPPKVFQIEALTVDHGSCLLVRYGDATRERFVVIDGGPDPTYKRILKPRLSALRHLWARDEPLEIEAVISTQADQPESGGIRRLLEDLIDPEDRRPGDDSGEPWLDIKRFWTNVFDPFATDPDRTQLGMSVLRIPRLARQLGLPVNAPFDRFVSRPIAGAPRVELAGGLAITVLGPRGAFWRFWVREVERALRKRDDHVGMPVLPGVIETCSSSEIYLQPSPVRVREVDPGGAKDRSMRNRTSIVLLLEFAERRALLTSDAAGSDIIGALAETGLLGPNDSIEVDLLVIPHYGSKRSVDRVFFDTVFARQYLVQENRRHFNPDPETLAMLASARGKSPYTLFFTGPEQGGAKGDYLAARERSLSDARKVGGLEAVFREAPASPLVIDLLADPAG